LSGFWNVRTLLQPEKMAEVAEEMERYGLCAAALQEIIWKGQGELRKRKYSIVYYGGEKPGQRDTGFYINEEMRKSVLLFEPINDRICRLRIKGKFQNITMISVYAPTEDSDDEMKNKFYDDLTKICDRISKHDILLILGIYNAKIGKETFINGVAGRHSLHEHTSDNGIRVCEFADCQNMWISSVSFQHKDIHKQTWKISGERGANQIKDHILVDRRHSSSVIDVRSCRGTNCDSDHFLVRLK
ncbi:Craniofacial development protein 2, partial [Harpegnathos saltator]